MYGDDGDDILGLPFCLHFLSALHSTLSQPGVKRSSLEKVSWSYVPVRFMFFANVLEFSVFLSINLLFKIFWTHFFQIRRFK